MPEPRLMTRTLEELAMNAWPALQTVLYDGWVLRFANGYTKRANSVHPLYAATEDANHKAAVCEDMYRARGLPVIFKMTPASEPAGLDDLLAARGYSTDSPTSVQAMRLPHGVEAEAQDTTCTETLSDEWLAAVCRLNRIDARHQPTLAAMLHALAPAPCFASVVCEDTTVACGLGVLQDGFLGLFDIVTDATVRRQGYGQRLVQSILAWGSRRGAHTAYLQVMLNNEPALHLYGKLGFAEQYLYWYRIRS